MKKEIRNGAILGYINIFINIIITFLYTPVMTRLIGQSEFGLYSLVSSIIAYLSVLDMGFGNAMVRYISKSLSKNDKKEEENLNGLFFIIYLVIGFIALIMGIILLLNVDNLFTSKLTDLEIEKAKILIVILSITVSLSFPLSIFDSYAMAREKFTFLKILSIIKSLLIPLTTLPFLLFGYKSIVMVLIMSIYNLSYHILTMFLCLKKLKMKFSFNNVDYNKKIFKKIINYSFFIFLNIIVDSVFNNTDQLILGSVSGTIAVSVYAIAMTISQAYQLFSTSISSLFLPKITKLLNEKDGEQQINDIFITVSRIQIYILSFLFTIFLIIGDKFINIWVGHQYNDAYYIVLLLIGPALIPLSQNIGISIIQAKNKHQFRAIMFVIIAVLNIVISIPLSRLYQGIGAAIGTAIATLLGQIITMNIFYYKSIKIDIPKYWMFLLRFLIPLIILCIFVRYLIISISFDIIKLVAAGIIYFILYFIYLQFFFNDKEKIAFKKILKRY